MKRINTRRIKAKLSYTIQTLAELLVVHPNTVHGWLKEGLPRIDNEYPYMMYGEEIIQFLNTRRDSKKVILALDEFRCCTCQTARKAWDGIADLQRLTSKTAMLKAICSECEGGMNKIISLSKQAEFEKHLRIYPQPDQVLIQSINNSVNCETREVQK